MGNMLMQEECGAEILDPGVKKNQMSSASRADHIDNGIWREQVPQQL